MPAISIDSGQKKGIDDVVKFVHIALVGNENFSLEARIVFVMEINRLFKADIDAWKKQAPQQDEGSGA